ncbi:ABC transporter permease [Bacteriovorax stolpii]|uniref:ABC transporter permease n=1 Tax=Bacteriovorax stolpii TaxID=960 RepID=A0A2K9NVS1_BACTC|nr:ABC transporter permease [Bacteriovorax stolpii]AUN99619.1 ABC transporter permease [Bacteriovorax stolpii]QDK40386.1 ABC transporter permease [Bacteriovorax stolpii]TDP51249.1 peptide/nickel transport system permease protein [Bacteriovorax stolpii]
MNLYSYILRRLLYVVPVLLGVCLIIFVIFNVVAPDPAFILLGKHATHEQIAQLHHELGMDRPFWEQYLSIVRSAFTFDFGYSWSSKQQIWEMIKAGAGPSLSITIPLFIIVNIVSISTALLVSFYRGKMLDKTVLILSIAMMSIPSLAYILFGQWYFAYTLGWFEISGYEAGFPNFIPYTILPVLLYIAISWGPDTRFYRSVILDEVYQDYVRTARAKGVGELSIMFKHVLKNAMIPILTYVIIQIPFLILGLLLAEAFFSIPGLGGITIKAINTSDFPVIKAMTILSAVGFIIFGVITDVLYTVVDPRMRLK